MTADNDQPAGCTGNFDLGELFPDIADSTDINAMRLHAQSYLDRSDCEEARIRFQSLINAFPDAPSGYIGLADVHFHLGRCGECAAVLKPAIELFPDNPYLHERYGRVALARLDYDAALRSFAKVEELNPSVPNGLLGQVQSLRELGRDREAVDMLKGMVVDFGTYPGVSIELAKSGIEHPGLRQEVTRALERLVEEHPDVPFGYIGLADVHLRYGHCDDCAAALEPAIKRFPDNPYLYERYGRMALARFDYDAALQAYEQVGKLNPAIPNGLLGQVQALALMDNPDLLAKRCDQLMAGFPQDRTALYQVARCAVEMDDTAKAVEYCKQAIDKHGADVVMFYRWLSGIYNDKSWLIKAYGKLKENKIKVNGFEAVQLAFASNDIDLLKTAKQNDNPTYSHDGMYECLSDGNKSVFGSVYINGLLGSGRTYVVSLFDKFVEKPCISLHRAGFVYPERCLSAHGKFDPKMYMNFIEPYLFRQINNDNSIAKMHVCRHPIDNMVSAWRFYFKADGVTRENCEHFIRFASKSYSFFSLAALAEEQLRFEKSPLWHTVHLEDCHSDGYRRQVLTDFFEAHSRDEAIVQIRQKQDDLLPPRSTPYNYRKTMESVEPFAQWVDSIPSETRDLIGRLGYEV